MSPDTDFGAPLELFNTLGRRLEPFVPREPGKASVYSCGPTVYAYQHIGNMRAYVFADTLRRVLRWKGYDVRHVINITDVGHLTSDEDEGEDKLEAAARREEPHDLGDRRALHRGVHGRPRPAPRGPEPDAVVARRPTTSRR